MFYRRFFYCKKIKLVLKLSVIEIYQLKSYCFLFPNVPNWKVKQQDKFNGCSYYSFIKRKTVYGNVNWFVSRLESEFIRPYLSYVLYSLQQRNIFATFSGTTKERIMMFKRVCFSCYWYWFTS